MSVLIRNPSSNPITLPFPFRGVLPAGASVPVNLSIAQVRAALGALASSLELSELRTGEGDLFARGLYTAIVTEPGATRLLTANDAFLQLRFSQACTVTIPAGLPFEPGITAVSFTQLSSGQVTLVGDGATLNTSETLKTRKQYATIIAAYVGENEWDVFGERESAA